MNDNQLLFDKFEEIFFTQWWVIISYQYYPGLISPARDIYGMWNEFYIVGGFFIYE